MLYIMVIFRRAPGSKFVPPVRREDREGGGGDSCLDAVRSRVHGGGPSGRAGEQGGAGAKGLPPELEGDERLRNVEPRMVELIMNEARRFFVSVLPPSSTLL